MEATKDRDRLELVHSLIFGLGALGKSVGGWVQWLSNPSIMNNFSEEELVEMNSVDADGLGIVDGEMVRVVSRRGEVTARAKVTEDSPPGTVSMTFHFGESPTNVLTNPALDPIAKIPEYKVCAIRVEKLETARAEA